MNLREFIAYNSNCPICSSKVTFSLHSKRRQSIRYEEDRLIVLFPLESLKKNQADFKVGYSFGLDNNSIRIEFYSYDEIRMDDRTPMFLIDRFRELNKNLGFYSWVKSCPCDRYGCVTQTFSLDEIHSIPPLTISNEYWTFSYNVKFIDMINIHNSNRTAIVCRKNNEDIGSSFEIPKIPFISVQETSARLQNLIPFS
jgi:hypothetical protein